MNDLFLQVSTGHWFIMFSCHLYNFFIDVAISILSHTVDRISAIDDVTYDLNWYDCPQELQKNVMFTIARAQKEISYTGFKLITCNIEGFGLVRLCMFMKH